MIDGSSVKATLLERLFGEKVVQNNLRSEVFEQIVALLLDHRGWKHFAGDWNSWDFEHSDGTRLEAKQSAAAQSWHQSAASKPRFDIRPKTGFWFGGAWQKLPERRRPAHLYLFGWHPYAKPDADHYDPDQWDFILVPEPELPAEQKSISLDKILQLGHRCKAMQLAEVVETARQYRVQSSSGVA